MVSTVPSLLWNLTQPTVCSWPRYTRAQSPNSTTHERAVWSELPVYNTPFAIFTTDHTHRLIVRRVKSIG